ncbi:MAG: hypothetical protein LBF89_02955 [Bacteroidales bacterium]|jgi:hypothetical protein|nr:hypothetical protein [Bacteroidales bacterium]
MLRFFRSPKASVIAVILLLGVGTWIHALSNAGPSADIKHGMPLFLLLNGFLAGASGLQAWCGLLLTLLVAALQIYINRLNTTDRISCLPPLCYILLTGGVPGIHVLHPVMWASFFLTIALILLLSSFRSNHLSYAYFTAPIYVAIAVFFYRYAYMYMLVIWICLFFFRPGYWREWVFSLLGFLFPFFWYFGWCYLMYNRPAMLFDMFAQMFSFSHTMPQWEPSIYFFFIFTVLLSLVSIGYLLRSIGSRKIIVRNDYYALLIVTAVLLLTTVIVPDTLPFAWYLIAFPLSFFISYYLAHVRSVRWGKIVLGLLMAASGFSQLIFYVKF